MSHQSYLLSITISLLLFSGLALSQQPPADPGKKDDVAEKQQKALKLLESLASDVTSLRSAENRARIGSNIADLLWKHDERRARSLFAAAGDDIRTAFSNTDPDESSRDESLRVFVFLRSNIIARIAKHDPELALDFLRSTRPTLYTKVSEETLEMERVLELQLASQVATRNPQLALKLARQSLAKGFSNDLLRTLAQIRQKDKAAAMGLYTDIVDKLRTTNWTRDPGASYLGVNLVRSFPPPQVDEQAYKDLIGVLLDSARSYGCAGDGSPSGPTYLCSELGGIFPQIEKYYASRAGGLRQWAGQVMNSEPMDMEFTDASEIFEKGTVEEVLALAPKYPQMRDRIYAVAVEKATISGDLPRARQIAGETPDEGQRTYMLQQLDNAQALQTMAAETLAEIQLELGKITNSEDRVQFLLEVAIRIGGNNRKAALSFLNQAGQILNSIKPGREQIGGQIQLASLYCWLKSDRGFAIMESLIPKLNELVTAGAVLDRVDNEYLRDGEWSMSGKGVLGGMLTALAQDAGLFAWNDFDRSVNLASQFERPELRLMAQSKLAQAIIEGTASAGPTIHGLFE